MAIRLGDTAPDFEDPAGFTYNITVVATDVAGSFDSQAITVTVTNDNEAPVLNPIGNPSVLENSSGVIATAMATDMDVGDTLTYSLAGVDAGLFSIDNVTGAITFTAPDFENPLDNGANNIYDIQVIDSIFPITGCESCYSRPLTLTQAGWGDVVTDVA